ncbi:probable E3 ubiquitin-protein ligase HERC4 isoform X2 [Anneissia japonica]|nr:probable E3 ubiquitin-protein ligase HERC4 isoform X2 [Anneissia japonica]XP_033114286.1 probable E3 ubiquitin-protein ligase HERC4 isoform X2 [Anneissia japonica]
MQDLVRGYQKCKSEEIIDVVIRRKKIWNCTISTIRTQKDFNFLKVPHVHFSGEEAVDLGGPKREYFWLITQKLHQVGVFEGHGDRLLFTHDIDLLQKEFYRHAGQVIAWSVLHGGPGYPHIHPGLLKMMCGLNPGHIEHSDIVDESVSPKLAMIANIQTDLDARDAISAVGDWAASNGCNRI